MTLALTEPAVTLTDYAIAIECTVFTLLLVRRQSSDPVLRFWFVVFFASIGAASLLGGTVHGFFEDAASSGRAILWPATLLSILVTSLAVWSIGAILQLGERAAGWVRRLAIAQLVILSLVVLFVTQQFFIAIIAYLPGTLFFLIALSLAYRRRSHAALGWGIVGLALTFVAAAVQQLRIAIHPVYFDHNALYHVIQGVALWMIFLAARWISTAQPPIRRTNDLTT